eukprot:m.310660 g.310660  ORF g.310660 m.310660 type:complete len:340 (+) comp53561_c0_seq1:110-1129(+)
MASNGNLKENFEEGWRVYRELQSYEGSSSDGAYQEKLGAAIGVFERTTRMVNELALFSDNEDVSEIATVSLRYLLLPALIGSLETKRTAGNRVDILEKAKAYIMDFLHRCDNYGFTISDRAILELETSGGSKNAAVASPGMSADLARLALDRQTKIELYRKSKDREALLDQLEEKLRGRCDDEEMQRRYFLVRIEAEIASSTDEVRSIGREMEMLKHMARMRDGARGSGGDGGKPCEEKASASSGKRRGGPVLILSRKEAEEKVFGAGYPSLPTITVEEFYESEYRDQLTKMKSGESDTVGKEEESEDTDEDEKLRKAREWDDFKDTHRRGWGNRQNRL